MSANHHADGPPSFEDMLANFGDIPGISDGSHGDTFAPPNQAATAHTLLPLSSLLGDPLPRVAVPQPPAAVTHAVTTRTVLCRWKVEPAKQWAKLKVSIPAPDCSSPKATLAYLRKATEVPGILKFALGHPKACVATEAPTDKSSYPVALSDAVCFTRNTSAWGASGQFMLITEVPEHVPELWLMVDCPCCSEHKFAVLQTPEPASLQLDGAACCAGDSPQIWQCVDCKKKGKDSKKRKKIGSQSPPRHTAAPPWVHDTDTDGNEVVRARSDAIVHGSLEVKANVTVQGKLVQRSDQRTKGNIQPTGADEDAANLEHLRHVDTVSCDETQGPMAGQHVDHGFIAQNLQAEFPGAVLMDAGLEKLAADQLGAGGWSRLQESSALHHSLKMPSFAAACSLQRQVLTLKVIKRRWKYDQLERPILNAVRSNGVLSASSKFGLPPLAVFKHFLERGRGLSRNDTRAALDDPELHLQGDTLRQFYAARAADSVTSTGAQDAATLAHATDFERAVQARLDAAGVAYYTEDGQKIRARRDTPGAPLVATPDFLMPPEFELTVGEAPVKWIEVKNFFGSALGYHAKKLSKQLGKYRRLYGPGAVVFKCGAGESVARVLPEGVVVLHMPPEA